IIYFGDTAHLPYGDKSPELIRQYSENIANFLLESGVKAIVIACNTASAVAREAVERRAGRIPVFNVVDPAVQLALRMSSRNQIGIIGTKTTIRSGIYRRTILQQSPNATVVEKATPLLVPIIEEGWHDNSISREVIEAYMSDTGFMSIDSLILGCTHYPLIKEAIGEYFMRNYNHSVEVIDSSQAVAQEIHRRLAAVDMLNTANDTATEAQHAFYVSDFSQNFLSAAELFLQQPVTFEKV
ncbi:MAG: glutamate racemase, partial [Bacteroidota bacterium]